MKWRIQDGEVILFGWIYRLFWPKTLATSCEELTHWKRLWCWEGLGAGGERNNRGWDGWMASLTWWTWVWVNSGSWWWIGRPGVLRFMGLHRVGHDWETDLNWKCWNIVSIAKLTIKKAERRRTDAFELLWTGFELVLEKTLESPLDCKEIQPVYPKGNQSWMFIGRTCWSWNSNTLATWCEELTRLKRPWHWERLKVRGDGDERGWDGWMASPTQWTWVWVNSGN